MSSVVKTVLSPLKPLCNIVKQNSALLTTFLFSIVIFSMLPLHLVYDSTIQQDVMDKVHGFLITSIGQLLIFMLFICLYMNADVENMVLLLYVFWLTHSQ